MVAVSAAGMPPNQAQIRPVRGGEAPPPVPQEALSHNGVPKFVEVSGSQMVLGMPPAEGQPPERTDGQQHRDVGEQPDQQEQVRLAGGDDAVDSRPGGHHEEGDAAHEQAGGPGPRHEFVPEPGDQAVELGERGASGRHALPSAGGAVVLRSDLPADPNG